MVEDPQQRRADVVGADAAGGRLVAGEVEEVVALVEGQAQRPRQRRDRRLRGSRAAPLLDPRVEVGRHVGELGDLLAAQAGGAAAAPGGQADVVGLQRFAAAAEEVGEVFAVHQSSMRPRPRRSQGRPVPG